jgi:hypothetical protein
LEADFRASVVHPCKLAALCDLCNWPRLFQVSVKFCSRPANAVQSSTCSHIMHCFRVNSVTTGVRKVRSTLGSAPRTYGLLWFTKVLMHIRHKRNSHLSSSVQQGRGNDLRWRRKPHNSFSRRRVAVNRQYSAWMPSITLKNCNRNCSGPINLDILPRLIRNHGGWPSRKTVGRQVHRAPVPLVFPLFAQACCPAEVLRTRCAG